MAQSFEEQMKGAFDLIADRLQRDLQAYFAAAADRISALVESECAEAASNAASDAGVESEAKVTVALQQVLEAVAAIEQATSLSDALQALAGELARHADRVGLFLLRDDTLRLWTGTPVLLDTGAGDLPAEIRLDEPGPIAEAARLLLSLTATRDAAAPAPDGTTLVRTTAAVPLILQGQVVAVIVAERDTDASAERLGVITELLARHTARVLESLTASQLSKLRRAPAVGSSVIAGL